MKLSKFRYDGGKAALAELKRLLRVIHSEAPSYEPVGWSKCGSCGFHDECWKEANTVNDVATILGVDQGLARKLHELGFDSTDKLLANFDAENLGQLKRNIGKREQKVGKSQQNPSARRSHATRNGTCTVLPRASQGPNYVMFDLEGMPPQIDDIEKVYLWGMQVFGDKRQPIYFSCRGIR